MDNPWLKQVGGDHYKKYAIQPTEYCEKNNLSFAEGCIVKYITRWRDKGGLKDLDKVIHYAEILKALYYDDIMDHQLNEAIIRKKEEQALLKARDENKS